MTCYSSKTLLFRAASCRTRPWSTSQVSPRTPLLTSVMPSPPPTPLLRAFYLLPPQPLVSNFNRHTFSCYRQSRVHNPHQNKHGIPNPKTSQSPRHSALISTIPFGTENPIDLTFPRYSELKPKKKEPLQRETPLSCASFKHTVSDHFHHPQQNTDERRGESGVSIHHVDFGLLVLCANLKNMIRRCPVLCLQEPPLPTSLWRPFLFYHEGGVQ